MITVFYYDCVHNVVYTEQFSRNRGPKDAIPRSVQGCNNNNLITLNYVHIYCCFSSILRMYEFN